MAREHLNDILNGRMPADVVIKQRVQICDVPGERAVQLE